MVDRPIPIGEPEYAPDVTPEQRREMEEKWEQYWRDMVPPVGPLAERMQSEAETAAALRKPGPVRDAYLEVFPDAAKGDA